MAHPIKSTEASTSTLNCTKITIIRTLINQLTEGAGAGGGRGVDWWERTFTLVMLKRSLTVVSSMKNEREKITGNYLYQPPRSILVCFVNNQRVIASMRM